MMGKHIHEFRSYFNNRALHGEISTSFNEGGIEVTQFLSFNGTPYNRQKSCIKINMGGKYEMRFHEMLVGEVIVTKVDFITEDMVKYNLQLIDDGTKA